MSSPGPLFETVVFPISNMALSTKMPPFELLVMRQRSIVKARARVGLDPKTHASRNINTNQLKRRPGPADDDSFAVR